MVQDFKASLSGVKETLHLFDLGVGAAKVGGGGAARVAGTMRVGRGVGSCQSSLVYLKETGTLAFLFFYAIIPFRELATPCRSSNSSVGAFSRSRTTL